MKSKNLLWPQLVITPKTVKHAGNYLTTLLQHEDSRKCWEKPKQSIPSLKLMFTIGKFKLSGVCNWTVSVYIWYLSLIEGIRPETYISFSINPFLKWLVWYNSVQKMYYLDFLRNFQLDLSKPLDLNNMRNTRAWHVIPSQSIEKTLESLPSACWHHRPLR